MHQQIWVGITDTERLVRYYGRLADKLRFRHQVLSALLAAIACGAAVPLLTRLPDYLGAGLFFLVALATVWLLKADYSAKATAASLFCAQYGYLALEWRELWYGEPTQARINELGAKYRRIASDYAIPVDHKLNRQAMEEADAALLSELGAGDSQGSPAAAAAASA